MGNEPALYKETPREAGGNPIIVGSTVQLATEEEIEYARLQYSLGKCPHDIVYDEPGWLYDSRTCGVCGISLGFI